MNKQELLTRPVSIEKLNSILNISWHDVSFHLGFSSNEMQNFLIARGYKIAVLNGVATVHVTHHEGGEVNFTGETYESNEERVIAVKTEVDLMDRNELPLRVDSKEAIEMDILSVFKREFKSRLLEKL